MGNLTGGKKKIELRPYQIDCDSKLNILDEKEKFSTLV